MYYVAIVCPAAINEKVLEYKHWMRDNLGCTVALKSPAHITLIPPFWMEETKETELQQIIQSFQTNLKEVEIQLLRFSHFSNKVIFISVKENPALNEIKKQTEAYFIKSFGKIIKEDTRSFHPHITIANRDVKPQAFIKAWQHFAGKHFEETFSIKTISLLKLGEGKWNVIGEKSW